MVKLNSARSKFPSDSVCALRAGILNDNEKAVETACSDLRPYVQAVAKTYCKRPADLPHFEQVALITIVRVAERFDPTRGTPIEHLVRVAVKRAILDELKSEAARSRRLEVFAIDPGEEPHFHVQDAAASPAEIVAQSELQSHLAAQVGSWLKSRPSAEREFIMLLFFEHLSPADVARRLRVSRAAVSKRWRSTIARARVELAHLWEFFSVN